MKLKFGKIFMSAAALLLATSICGCSVNVGTNSAEDSTSSTDSVDSSNKVDSNKIVAQATVGDNSDDLSVTYGEFEREYLYYLKSSRIEDDTAASVAETCKQQRENIINNIIIEKVILKKAHELNVDTITDEEQKELDEQFEENYKQQIKYIGENAAAYGYESDSSESRTEEEIEKIGKELFSKILDESNMTLDILKQWSKSALIGQKLMKELGKEVSRSEAEKAMNESIESAKELYKSDVVSYERSNYTKIYIPDGSRMIKHILLGFSDEDMKQIQALRTDGKDGEADTYRAQKAAELADKVAEVEKKLDDGEDFMKLVGEYSADASATIANPNGYLIVPDGKAYMAEFQKTAMEIEKVGGRKNCVTDYGVHIMIYASEAKINPDDLSAVTDSVLEQLRQNHYYQRVYEWKDEYKFQIEYDVLRIDAPESWDSDSSSDSSSN